MSKLYDIVRIDHFRGFDSYYAIPAKDDTARNGEWRKGPGMDLFRTMEKKLGKLNIIVEDLGFLTPSVLKLVKDSGFPGMKVTSSHLIQERAATICRTIMRNTVLFIPEHMTMIR